MNSTIGLSRLVVTSLAFFLCAGIEAASAQTNWKLAPPASGDWFVLGNWTGGLPTANTETTIANGGTASISSGTASVEDLYLGNTTGNGTITQTGGTLNLTYDLDIARSANSTGTYNLSGSGQVINGYIIVGDAGNGVFNQNGGSVQTNDLSVAENSNSTGSYIMTAGTVSAGSIEMGGPGTVTYNQSGGTVSSTKYFSLHVGTGSISGSASLSCGLDEQIGNATFTQNGGTNMVGRQLLVGGPGGFGNFDLMAGALTSGSEVISYTLPTNSHASTATFSQSGGSNTTGGLTIGAGGTYVLSAGSLQIGSGGLSSSGTLNFAGSSTEIDVAGGSFSDISQGTIQNASSATLSIGPNSILTVAPGFNPSAVFGHFSDQGIVHTAGTDLVVPANNVESLQGSINDHVQVYGTLTTPTGGLLALTNGVEVFNNGTIDLDQPNANKISVNDTRSGISTGGTIKNATLDVGSTATGIFTQSGGSLSNVDITIGDANGSNGSFVQTGGSNSLLQVIVGKNGVGDFNMSAGSTTTDVLQTSQFAASTFELSGTANLSITAFGRSTSEPDAVIGFNANATGTQTGGSLNVSQTLYVSYQEPAIVTYTQSAGSVGALELQVAYQGEGHYVQMGGTVTVGDTLSLGASQYFNPANGQVSNTPATYSISNGSIQAANISIGAGRPATFTQTGGTVNATGALTLGAGGGIYQLKTGTLTAANESVNYSAQFQQSGGTNTVNYLSVNASGSYLYTGGQLNVNKNLSVQPQGTFDFGSSAVTLDLADGASAYFNGTLANGSKANIVAGAGSFIELPPGFNVATGLGSLSSQGVVHVGGVPLSLAGGQQVDGTGTIIGNVTNDGLVSPGHSIGAITINGSYDQLAAGNLKIELGGNSSGEYDLLNVNGSATLGGTLSINLLNGFVPQPSDTFIILTAQNLSGDFSNAPGKVDFAGGTFDVRYSGNEVMLDNFVAPEPAACLLLVATLPYLVLARRRRAA